MIENVLMVCIGNICRSPLAEGLLKKKAQANGVSMSVSSAGLSALTGAPADLNAQALMRSIEGDISDHRARQVEKAMVLQADLILTMDLAQQREIESKFPMTCGKVHRLGKWGQFDIMDPYRRPWVVFEQVFSLIDVGIEDWCRVLWNKR